MNINIIVALCKHNNGIGINNKLPWYYPEDLKFFSRITKGNGNNAVIMGRKTYESIGKELSERTNIIISKTLINKNLHIFSNINDALSYCSLKKYDETFIIGGESIYKESIKFANKLYVTEIDEYYECDTFFPEIKDIKSEEIVYLTKDFVIKLKLF